MLKVLALAFAVVPTIAFAHVGIGDTHGAARGFLHPLTGVDHICAMVAVGMFAAQVGGRGVWFVPLAFVGMMTVGGAIGMAGIGMPLVETGIGLSVLTLGLAIALLAKPPVPVAMALVGFFALFHGHAHGAEMPDNASGLTYAMGFIAATALLHAAGVMIGVAMEKLDRRNGERAARVIGGAMSVAGVAVLGGFL